MDVPKVLDVRVEARGRGESEGILGSEFMGLGGSIFDCEFARGAG